MQQIILKRSSGKVALLVCTMENWLMEKRWQLRSWLSIFCTKRIHSFLMRYIPTKWTCKHWHLPIQVSSSIKYWIVQNFAHGIFQIKSWNCAQMTSRSSALFFILFAGSSPKPSAPQKFGVSGWLLSRKRGANIDIWVYVKWNYSWKSLWYDLWITVAFITSQYISYTFDMKWSSFYPFNTMRMSVSCL